MFKTVHCHFIYLSESCTNLSLNRMIYPFQGAMGWIMCRYCSLFCFNWVFWKGDGGQPLLGNVLLVYIAPKTGTCGVREIWQHRSSQESNTRSHRVYFSRLEPGYSDTCAVNFWTNWRPGSSTLAHQCVLCQRLHNSSWKVSAQCYSPVQDIWSCTGL